MAGYEKSAEGFQVAVLLAASGAAVMPYAWPLVGLLELMAADPGAQDQAGEKWLKPSSVNNWPTAAPGKSLLGPQVQQEWRPPMAASTAPGDSSDIAFLRSELRRLSREIGEAGDWAGRAYRSFMDKVEELDGYLATLDENRVGCGKTLKCSAQAFDMLMSVCITVGGFLSALGMYVMASYMVPTSAVSAHAQAMRAVRSLHETVSAIFKQHWKFVMKATLILAAAGVAYNQFAKDLMGIQAVSASKPNLIQASAMWDPSKSDIVDSPTSQFDTGELDTPSFLPGW